MNLDKDTLNLLQQTAVKAAGAQMVAGLNPRRQVLVVNGEMEMLEIPPAIREHQMASLEDLILFAGRIADEEKSNPVVYHSQDRVVLVIDDADRRDQVIFHLHYSREFAALVGLSETCVFDQRQFLRLLRLVLNVDAATVALFRRLDWKVTNESRGEVLHGRESLGRSVEAAVQGSAEVPDELPVAVPIYDNFGEDMPYLIRCLIEFDAVNARLQFLPAPGELVRVLDRHQASIRSRLEAALQAEGEKGVPIYYGKP